MSPDSRPRPWNAAERRIAVGLILLGTGICVPAFIELYLTATEVVHHWFGAWSWTVPVSGEVAFMSSYGTGVLLAMRRVPGGWLRLSFQAALIAGAMILQVLAAKGHLAPATGHMLVVIAFFGTLTLGKGAIVRLIRAETIPDKLTMGEWISHPFQSLALWRRMMARGERSKSAARLRYAAELYAVALAQADARVGRQAGWRKRLPVTLRYQLGSGLWPAEIEASLTAPDAAAGAWQELISGHVSSQLSLLGSGAPGGPVRGTVQDTVRDTPESTVRDTAEGIVQDSAQVTVRDTSGDTGQDTARSTTRDIRYASGVSSQDSAGVTVRDVVRGTGRAPKPSQVDRSLWPSARPIPNEELLRRTRAAVVKWGKTHEPGERLPATQLADLLQLRMSRTTATALLAEAYKPHLATPAAGE